MLQRGRELLATKPGLGPAELANLIVPLGSERRYQGYGYDSVRKILAGRFGPATRRRLSGLF